MPNKNSYPLTTVAFRWSVVAMVTLFVLAPIVQAEPPKAATPASITGVYNGTYAGAQGPIKFKLLIMRQDNVVIDGEFTLYLPDGSGTKAYITSVSGAYIYTGPNQKVSLSPDNGKWDPRPDRAVME